MYRRSRDFIVTLSYRGVMHTVPVHSDTNSASLGSILARQQLRNDYSLACPPLFIARYSFIQLRRLRRHEENENAQISKR